MTSADEEEESDDSSSDDYVDRWKSDGKKGNELTPAIVLEKDNNAVITSKQDPKTTKKITDNMPRSNKKRKTNKDKSAKVPVDFHVKPATSSVSMQADVSMNSRLDLFEKRVRWQH
jgi:hypothetical protein